ncbi:MAG: SCO family protein, partial [Chloroflexi bacterium]|nr:SCO family protein [Chloroflexota bacterium]
MMRPFGVPIAILLLWGLVITGCRSELVPSGQVAVYQGTQIVGRAEDFKLTDHHGAAVAPSDFRGRVVVLAFLDPKCTDVCPLTALNFRTVNEGLGPNAASMVFLAVNVNSAVNSVDDMAAATVKWGVDKLPNWHFLTGSEDELQ